MLLVPIMNHLSDIIFCKKYMKDMHTRLMELDGLRVAVADRMNRNTISMLEVPDEVSGWLQEVERITARVGHFPKDFSSSSLWRRHKHGRRFFKMIVEIETVKKHHSLIRWTDDPVPLERAGTMNVSTSASSSDHNDFVSREHIYMEALKALGSDHKSHMIALWGIGGVGKTTLMERLTKAVEEKKMFDCIIKSCLGEKADPIAIQQTVADHLGIKLNETGKSARADKLRKWFEACSPKYNILIIFDDAWEAVDLNDIGLSPLPNHGVGIKVLLTSQNRHVCTMMGAGANSIFNVQVITEAEAHSLFWRLVEISNDADPELRKMGKHIVRKCCGLPIAIKTLALTLRNKAKDAWKDALFCLDHHHIHNVVHEVFKISYKNLKDEETESIFLLCGLFPKDFNISTEDLVRYGWGLKVFTGVSTLREARNRLNTCIERLLHTSLLTESNDVGCVRMHDLVRAFVLDMLSRVEHASIVNHGSMSKWWPNDVGDSCKRISLTCNDMSEFPRDLRFPNLSILKLMRGDKSLRFPQDFYREMEKLEVISYDEIQYPLLPSASQCSTNLRVLHLHRCSLMFDCSSIGNLLNLQVLSFANSGIEWLPYTIGNLVKLRLLDLTGCAGLRIDNGVFENLVELEELYTMAGGRYGKAISFTNDNCNEIAKRSRNLSALEFEFFRNNAQPKNMSFEKLERFKISVGRSLDGELSRSSRTYENTLQLVTNKGEVLDSRMNELFEKTDVLCLSVGDMNDLEDFEVKCSHPHLFSSFNNVRVLVVSRCEELKYLFTLGVAKALSKLEHLQVSSSDNMEELIHIESIGVETVTLPKLKFLSLVWLPNLSGLCHNGHIVELPQLVTLELDGLANFTSIYPKNKSATSCLLKEEVVIPKLERLVVFNMENLKEIWPYEFDTSGEVKLREIEVKCCDNLTNLFPCNPILLLHHLEELRVEDCGSVEVLFNIDLDFAGGVGKGSTSNLRSIQMKELGKLREVWRIKAENKSLLLIRGFQAVENIQIERCKSFTNVFTPVSTNFDLGALVHMNISDCGESGRNNESVDYSQEEENNLPGINNNISDAVFPSYLAHSFHNLRGLSLSNWEGVPEVVFEIEIESPEHGELVTAQDYQQRMLPYLENLDIIHLERMSHVWKCNWNKFSILPKQHSESPFHNLTTIYLKECESIKYLFSPLMAKLFSNLKKLQIQDCDGIEEVVSNRDHKDEEKTTSASTQINTTVYPCLDSLTLSFLPNLKCIGDGANCGSNEFSFENTSITADFLDQSKFPQVGGVSWTLCQYSKEISISYCDVLSSAIPCYALGQMQMLQVLRITRCDSMKEVFESQGMNNTTTGCGSSSIDDGNSGTSSKQGPNYVTVLKLPMLRVLEIKDCDLLEHIFTFSTLESLWSLEELTIWDCKAVKVIVKEENGEQATPSGNVVFPSLKSIALVNLPNLVGFFLGMNEFQWPSLDDVTIKGCPQMIAFTVGQSLAPGLKYIRRSLGKHSLDKCGLNFDVTTTTHHQTPVPSLEATSSCTATAEGLPWSFHNLIELDLKSNISLEKIIPSNELQQLQNLEKIHVSYCHGVEEVFEALEGTSGGLDESQTVVVELPNLTEVSLAWVDGLRNMWNSNQWTVFKFGNLTTVSIHGCDKLEHVFTRSMVTSLLQLQELHIKNCDHMGEIIVKDTNLVAEEESDGKMKKIELPCLRSLILDQLPCLKGFCLWNVDFSLPLLDTLKINRCQQLTVFTQGSSATPELREIETSFGSFYAGEGINFFIKTRQEEFKSNRLLK
ncbi:unnamed protein product [Lactuca saligna]|uniref:NB-ARC domain-containing protein n=1 Tax=Lactuca saligna TaxID=75948 RepID=A0AA35YEJ9_LACSI|nr:unnamed protein product [Lactuca saligna]